MALFAGLAAADEESEPTSVAQACLPHRSIDRTKILDNQNLLFVTHAGQTYHNLLPRVCPGVRRNSLLTYNVDNELCVGHGFAVLLDLGTTRMPTQICKLGMFRPVTEDEVLDLVALTEQEPESRRKARRRSEREMIETEVVELPDDSRAPNDAARPAP